MDLTTLERLEARELLAFSDLGFSLPDLIITGEAGRTAAWGGTISVSGFLQNIGASTITEPFQQAPPSQVEEAMQNPQRATSTADAPNTTIAVFLSPHRHSLKGSVLLTTFNAPSASQNSVNAFAPTPFPLPSRPRGFPGSGGTFYIRLMANSSGTAFEANPENNISSAIPVKVVGRALPEVRAIALGVPPVMQPGDTISPTIQVENFGTAPAANVQVALVASVTPTFTIGSVIILPVTTIANIPALSEAPTMGNAATFGEQNLLPPSNVVTYTMSPVTLPTTPGTYFLGVVVDPNGNLTQLSLPRNALEQIHIVGPPIGHLPPAGVVSGPNTEPFPNPASGQLIGNLPS
jgi:hypothetical protein